MKKIVTAAKDAVVPTIGAANGYKPADLSSGDPLPATCGVADGRLNGELAVVSPERVLPWLRTLARFNFASRSVPLNVALARVADSVVSYERTSGGSFADEVKYWMCNKDDALVVDLCRKTRDGYTYYKDVPCLRMRLGTDLITVPRQVEGSVSDGPSLDTQTDSSLTVHNMFANRGTVAALDEFYDGYERGYEIYKYSRLGELEKMLPYLRGYGNPNAEVRLEDFTSMDDLSLALFGRTPVKKNEQVYTESKNYNQLAHCMAKALGFKVSTTELMAILKHLGRSMDSREISLPSP